MIKKTIALLVALSFVFSNIAFADTPKNINPDVKKRVEITTDPEKIVVPRDYGLVKSRYTAKDSKKLVIHIQDAHCNYEAQSNIIKILECLIKNDGLGLISVEGADGFIDTSWFKAFPDSDIRKEVADYFMKKGEITGPEFLSITSDYSVKLFGAETRSYYIENLNAFTSSYPLKEDTERHFNQIKAIINKLKNYIYSEELREFDSKIQDYEVKKLSFTDYVKYLEGLGQKRNVSLRQYENFFKLVSVLIYEKKIDFSVVDKERAALIDFITKKLDKEQLTDLVNKSLEFKVGKIASIEYYAYLKALAIKHGVSLLTEYPNLFNYIIYNSVYSKIENERLFEDIKKFEGAVKEKMFANDDQRTLDRLSRHIDTLLGLVNIKLLNDDFDYYKSHKEEFEYEAFSGFINKMTTRYGFAYEIDAPSEAVKESMPKLEDFYAIAIKRDKALVDNTIGAMNKEDARISVLVTGGFHSEGIAKLLEKQNISYLVVCPNITKDVETPYIKILTNQRTPLEDILSDTGATVPDAKNVKGSMLAPYLITAARINNIGEIAGRTASDLDTWARMSIALWLPAAAADIKKMNIEPTPAVIAVRFNSDVGRAVDEYYLANRGLDVQTKRQLIENARVVKELALPIITELLSAQEAASPAVIEGLIETEKNMYAKIAGIDNKENGYKLSLERMTSFGLTVEMLMSDPILAAAEDKQLIAKLIAFGKGSIFRFWKDLSGDQKKEFIEQLKTIKINSVEELYQRLVLKIGAPFAPSIKITDENLSSPHVIDITKDTPRNLEAKNIGEESYRKGEVALLELAGGTGSRQALSDSFPKIMVEVSIFTNATLAKERLSRIRAEAEEYGKPIPLIIMTSDVTNTPLTKFFNDNIIKGRYFGEIPTDWVIFVPQIVMPQVTDEGEYIIKKEKNKIVVGGFGHGDARDLILQDQKVLTWLARFGIKYILLTQVDNAFKVGCRAIGYHIASLGKARPGAEHISAVIVEKRSPDEKVGLALEIDKQLSIVEYTDIPTELLYKMYVYVINGEEIVFIKEGSKYVAKSHDEIRNMLKSMEKPGDVEKWVKEYCVSKDNIPEGSIINISDKPYTAGELRSQARLWLGAGSINQLIWTLSTLIGKPALPPIVQRGKAVEGYEPAAGKFFTKPKDKTGPKLGANKFECFDFDGWRVGPIDGAVLKVDRSGEGIEGGFAPTKDAEGVGSDTVSASQQIKSRNYKFLLKERCDWTFVPDAVVELTPAFAFGDGRYLPSKIKGKSNIKGSMRLSGRNTTVGENFNVDTGAEFILNVTDEYNSNAQVAVGKNITVRPGVKVTFNIIGTGRLVIEDNAIFDVNGIYDIPEGKELHIARDGKNVAIRFIKIDESDVGAVRMDGGSLTVKEHGARSYQRPEEDSVNGALANLINEGRARSFLPYRRMGLSAKYDLALVSWRMDYKGLEEKDFKKGFATDNIIRGNISKLKSLLLNGHGLNLVIVAGLKERLEKLGLAEDLLLHYGVTRNNVYMDEEDFKYLLSLPDGADRIMQGVIHEKAHIDNPDLSEDKVEAIASSTSIRAAMIDRLEKEIASLMKERFADETTGRRKAGLSKIIGVLIAKAKKWDIAERHALEIARQKEKDAEVFKSSKVLKGVDIENENMKHERARTDNPRLTPDVIEVLASSHNVRLAALMQGMRTDQVEAIDRAYEEVYKKIVENGKEYTPEDVALKYNISNEIAVALLDKVNEESGYNLLKREMYQSVIDNTPQAIKDNPLVDIMQKSKIQIKFTRANLGDFDPVKNPEGMNLKGWLARYKKEASASTAGIRGVQNILFPNDPRELIGQKAIILATVAKTLVAKELQAKNYAGRELHKLASSEVRYNSKEYVEFISRLQAALGIKTHIPVNKETIPIWMTSFLIFKYDLMGGEYVTSSHAISKKIATKDLNFEGSQYVPEESKLFVDKIEEIVKTIEQTGEYVITFSAADDAAIDQDFMKRVNNGVDDYAAYLKGGIATPDNLELIKQGRSRIFIDVVGGCMYRTMRNIFDKLGILNRFGWLHTREDPYF
ncbi:MAG: UTP--glucose-1-phosphate uridylyltransferase, partial [Candidatus Omnitrophota bacterium]|nr:UTP--glucose-1-phosphate uridylyltransferase [Candidatus Omnitrophota bacterium]